VISRPPQRWLLVPFAAALGMIALALLVPLQSWIDFFAHELRTERNGGVVVETTVAGARLFRAMLAGGGAIAIVLSLALARATRPESGAPGAAKVPPPRTSRLVACSVIGLSLVALLARAPRIGESLWYDEISALLDFSQFGPGAVMGNYFVQSNHILHQILVWFSIEVFGGVDEFSIRAPALIASLLTVPAMWSLARASEEASASSSASASASSSAGGQLPGQLPGQLAALLAAFIAALAPVCVLEGVEARGYSMMILAACVATTLLLRARDAQPTGRAGGLWALYALVIALGVWAHLVTVAVALGHGLLALVWLFRSPTRRVGLAALVALLLAATLTLVFLSPALPDMLRIRREFAAVDGNEPTLLGPEGLHALLQLGGAWGLAAIPGLGLLVLGLWRCRGNRRLRLAATAALLGLPVVVALALLGNSWLYARFLLFAMPGAILLMAFAAATVLERERPVAIRVAVGVVALATMVGWIIDLSTRPPKQPLRDAARWVAEHRGPEERTAVVGLIDNVLAFYGVATATGPLGRDLERVLDRDAPNWIIVMYPRSVPQERFDLLKQRGFAPATRLQGWVDWDNGDVLVFHRPESARTLP